MFDTILSVISDALIDSLKMLPFLFGAYLFIEFLEHKASNKLKNALANLGPLGPVGGAILGAVPQCGFSVAASNLFSGRVITIGTLISVFISTSDEAIPVLLSSPSNVGYIWKLIVVKILIAIVAGMITDVIYNLIRHGKKDVPFQEICKDCDCEHEGIIRSALHHTINIFIFIVIINLILGFAIEFVGKDRISYFLLGGSVFQPFLTALIGFIPNCGASVILTELFINGTIPFGSAIAGLCTGAGMGLAVLFDTNKHLKQNLYILIIMYCISVISGIVLNFFFI
jgi:hypothetical protein